MKIKNETGNDIKLKSALGYRRFSSLQSACVHDKAVDMLSKDTDTGDSRREETPKR